MLRESDCYLSPGPLARPEGNQVTVTCEVTVTFMPYPNRPSIMPRFIERYNRTYKEFERPV